MRKRWLVPAMGALLLLATACGGGSTTTTTKPTNTVTTDFSSNIETLDPGQWVDVTSMYPMQEIYSTLVGYNKTNSTIVPDAATWTVDPTGMIYTFKIQPGVVFSNGDPMTATDVVDSLNRVTSCNASGAGPAPYGFAYAGIVGYDKWGASCDKNSQPPAGVTGLTGVVALNSTTVQITLSDPQAYFLNTLALMSAVILDHTTIGAGGTYDQTKPVGSGPYMLKSWNRGHQMILVKNPKWWGAQYGLGNPSIATIVFNEKVTTNLQLLNFQQGKIDFMGGPLDSATYLKIQSTPSLKALYHIVPENGIVYLSFNNTQAPFNTKDAVLLRQAINYAIDKAQLSKTITNGRGPIASQPLPPGIPGYNSSIQPYAYDTTQAQSLVNQWKTANNVTGPINLTLIYPSNSQDHTNTADFVQSALSKIGITVTLKGFSDVGSYWPYEDDPTKAWNLAWTDWFQDYPDAQDFEFNLLSTQAFNATNVGNWTDPQFQTLITTADNLPAAQEATRVADYQKAEQIAHDQAAWVYLYYYYNDALVQPWMSPAPTGNNVNLYLHPVQQPEWQFMTTSH